MNITNIRIRNLEIPENNERSANRVATVNVVLDNNLALHGISIIKGEDGKTWITMPSRRVQYDNGKKPVFREYFHPISKEARTELSDAILAYYDKLQENPDAVFEAAADAGEPMKIDRVTVTLSKKEGSTVLAWAEFLFDNGMVFSQIRVVKRHATGEFALLMPSRKYEDRRLEIYHPINSEFRKLLTDAVETAYNTLVSTNGTDAAEAASGTDAAPTEQAANQ